MNRSHTAHVWAIHVSAERSVLTSAATLRIELDETLDRLEGDGRAEAILVARRKLTQLAEDVFNTVRANGKPVDKHTAGIRPDIATGHQADGSKEEETWVDITGTNLLAHSMAKGRFVQLQNVAAHGINPRAQAPSRNLRAFRVAESRKRRKFAQLLAAAQQHLTGEAQVQFLTFGFSTQGTLSPGAEETIKCLKEAYGEKCEGELAPRDGAPMK
jgi:hypothetical protein